MEHIPTDGAAYPGDALTHIKYLTSDGEDWYWQCSCGFLTRGYLSEREATVPGADYCEVEALLREARADRAHLERRMRERSNPSE